MAGVEAVNVPPEREVINIVSGQIVAKQFDPRRGSLRLLPYPLSLSPSLGDSGHPDMGC